MAFFNISYSVGNEFFQVLYVWKSLNFLIIFFAGCRILGWQFYFFQYFKDVDPLSSHLYCFQWEICHHPIFIPL